MWRNYMIKESRPTVAQINLTYLYDNYCYVQKHIGNKTLIPVVKANAYGHGSIEVVSYLYQKGVRFFAVSLLEEALELKKVYPDIDVLVMGVIFPDDLQTVSENRITYTISDSALLQATVESNFLLKFHIKIDTGMNRLGFKDFDEVMHFMIQIKTSSNLTLEGVYTHFATADSNEQFHLKQRQKFSEFLKVIPYHPPMIHVSNSSSTMNYEQDIPYTTHVRVGILLYGLTLDEGLDFLKPVMQIKTRIVQIKKLAPKDYVSYNITYQAKTHERIGVLPIGYADGLIRKNQGGAVDINRRRYTIVGRICMDQTMVKIDDTVKLGDDVVIMGSDIVTTDEVAQRLQTINYEVICQITSRVRRVYIKEEVKK